MPEPNLSGPFLIDNTDFTKAEQIWGARAGPFVYGNNIYIIWASSATGDMHVFKSIDSGQSWTELSNSAIPKDAVTFMSTRQVSSAVVRIAYQDYNLTRTVKIATFDLSSEAFTILSQDYTFGGGQGFVTYDFANNTDCIFLANNAVSPGQLDLIVWSGTAWNSVCNVWDNIASGYFGVLNAVSPYAGDNKLRVVYKLYQQVGPFNQAWYYRVVATDGTLATPVLLFSKIGLPLWQFAFCDPVYNGTQVELCYVDPTDDSPNMLYGDVTTDPVTFNGAAFSGTNVTQMSASVINGITYINWIELDTANSIDRMMQSTWDGSSATAVVLIHDEWNSPSAITGMSQSGQFLHSMGNWVLMPDGNFGWYMALEYIVGGSIQHCTGFFWTYGETGLLGLLVSDTLNLLDSIHFTGTTIGGGSFIYGGCPPIIERVSSPYCSDWKLLYPPTGIDTGQPPAVEKVNSTYCTGWKETTSERCI